MNFPEPTTSKPSLLSHDELRRLFHELGHAMHNLLSETQYARFHGTNVDRDFVEAPSMMLENFLWTPRHMKEISCHYSHLSPAFMQTWQAEISQKGSQMNEMPKTIPDEVVQKLMETKNLNGTLANMGKIFHGKYDLAVYGESSKDMNADDLASLWHEMRTEIMGLAGSESYDGQERYGFSNFRGIMGNYDAGYYTYLL